MAKDKNYVPTEAHSAQSALESKRRHLNSLKLNFLVMKIVALEANKNKIAEKFFTIFGSSNLEECKLLLESGSRIKGNLSSPSFPRSIFVGMVIKLNSSSKSRFSFIELVYLRFLFRRIPISSRLLQYRLHDLGSVSNPRFVRERMKIFYQTYSLHKIHYRNPEKIDKNYYVRGNGLIHSYKGEIIASDPSLNLSATHNAGFYNIMIKSMVNESLTFMKRIDENIVSLPDSPYIFLGSRCSSNYWHFLIEDAARLIIFKKNHPNLVNPKIIISGDATRCSLEIVSKIYPQSTILRFNGRGYSGQEIYIPSSSLKLDDEPRFGVHHTFNYSTKDLLELRNEILSTVGDLGFKAPTKFYVRRKSDHRLILGEEQLERLLLDLDFAIVDLSELGFDEQVSLFSNAELVVGAAGAGWANLIFASTGVRVLSLIGEDAAPWDMHRIIARDFGLEYQQLVVEHVSNKEFFYSSYLHRDIQIGVNDLEKIARWVSS
jgi:capsular polysaccharide biosynthesis protein